MLHFLTIGTVLGLSAGFAPGPLLTLVIAETLQHDIKAGIKVALTNALSPHPYLFWFSVGTPTMTKAMNLNSTAPAAFIIGFYSLLVGSKILLAILVGKSKTFLSGTTYIYTMRFLGLTLCLLAMLLFYDGLRLLKLL